jgi:hypothetical protein
VSEWVDEWLLVFPSLIRDVFYLDKKRKYQYKDDLYKEELASRQHIDHICAGKCDPKKDIYVGT